MSYKRYSRKNIYTSITFSVSIKGQKQRSDKHINYDGRISKAKVIKALKNLYADGDTFYDIRISQIEYLDKGNLKITRINGC